MDDAAETPAAGVEEPQPAPEKPAVSGGKRGCSLSWLLTVLLLSLLVRAPGLWIPLDQDGSVFCYSAMRWAEGELPYRDVWDHKPPLIYLAYMGLFAICPPAPATVNAILRAGSAACDLLTALLLFLLVWRLFGRGAGVVAALVFGAFAGAPCLQLEAFQPERLTLLFITAGMLAALGYVDTQRYVFALLSGLAFGVAMLAKQIAAPVGLLVWVWATADAWRAEGREGLRRIILHSVLLAGGVVIPWAACAAYFWVEGALDHFWTCVYAYNVIYATEHRKGMLIEGLRRMWEAKVYDHAFLWATAAVGVAVALVRREQRRGGLVILGWIFAAFLALFLPGQFAYYYYIPTVAPLAAASAVALVGLGQVARSRLALPLRVAAVGVPALALLAMVGFAAKRGYGQFKDHTSPRSTNVVIADVAKYIGERTTPSDRIYMWGGRPQVYVLSGRRNVCPYLYNFYYGLPRERAFHYRPEKLKGILDAVVQHQPRYVVVVSEVSQEGKEKDPFEMFPDLGSYVGARYERVPEPRWEAAERWVPRVYRRKAG